MATKPTPGGSDGTYGTELNEFLDVSLAADGKVKTEALQTDATAPSADAALANKKYVDDTYLSGQAVQIVNTQTGAVIVGTTAIPYDDTIPQITEGTQVMTLTITPTNASNKLKIEIVAFVGFNTTNVRIVALFQDSTVNALAAGQGGAGSLAERYPISFIYHMIAGTTSETTFKVRAGSGDSGNMTFNGFDSARKLGGVMASSITITEIKV